MTPESAVLHVRFLDEAGETWPSATMPGANVRVEQVDYEIDLLDGSEWVFAIGRPTRGRQGRPGGDAVDETLAALSDDQQAAYLAEAREHVARIIEAARPAQ